jgi:cytochrome b pre-mRNA-processing protein 3
MGLLDLFAPAGARRVKADAQALLAVVSQHSRAPDLFVAGAAADTFEGRTEILMAHAAVAMIRLKAEPEADALAQAFADAFFRFLDSGLREAGVGDLSVPKRMTKLAQSFYGRLSAYGDALAAGDRAALAGALTRNALMGRESPFADVLAERLAQLHARLGAAALPAVVSGEAWPRP